MTTCVDELVSIPVGERRISGRLTYAADGCPSVAALVAGPHPLLGGRPDNPIITSLRSGLASRGAAVLTFDYQDPTLGGIDAAIWSEMVSEFWRSSHVSQEEDWRRDVSAAAQYLRAAAPGPIVLIGYSFGCRGVADESTSADVAARICISPNPREHDFSGLYVHACPLLVIAGDNDFSCPAAELQAWFVDLPEPKVCHCLHGAEHFFRGRESEVAGMVIAFLDQAGILKSPPSGSGN